MTAAEWRDEEGLHLVPTDRLDRIIQLVEATVHILQVNHPGWTVHYRPRFADIRTSQGGIRLQVRADLFEKDGTDVSLGLASRSEPRRLQHGWGRSRHPDWIPPGI